MTISENIRLVWTPNGDCSEGEIRYPSGIPEIILKSGKRVSTETSGMYYEEHSVIVPNNQGTQIETNLGFPIRVQFTPLFSRTRPYAEQFTIQENIFPRSSESWFSRMTKGDFSALYMIHEIQNDTRLWMVIVDRITGKLYEKHFIQPYEFWVLLLDTIEDHRRNWNEALDPKSPDSIARNVMTVLDDELSWSEIATLTEGIALPAFSRGSVRETLEPLIPPIIRGQFRYELMAFLALTVKRDLTVENPIVFFDSLSSLSYLKALLEVHYRFIAQDVKPPSYLTLLNRVVNGSVENERVFSETLRERIFGQFLYSIMEKTPDWRPIAIKYIKHLNTIKDVTIRLPIPPSSRVNGELWRDRFALYSLGLHLRAHVRVPVFGLRRVLYLGNAHRWAHPMLSWSASLGVYNNHPLHMQEMIMSTSALERVKRVLPSIIEITWSARAFNPHLFDTERMEWSIPQKRILRSLEEGIGFVKLKKGFEHWKKRNCITLSNNEARLIDNVVARLNLSYLETSQGAEFLGSDGEKAGEFLTQMREKKAIQIFYEFNETGLLRPMVTVANGDAKRIMSLTRAMLENTPSSVALLAKGNKTSFIISSVPTDTLAYLSQELPAQGNEFGLNIRCMVPDSFRNYSGDLFQRLLLPDGSWSEDVSGLVTQVRSALSALSPEITREVLADDLGLASVLTNSRLQTRSEVDAKI